MVDDSGLPERRLICAVLERAFFDAIGQIGLKPEKGEKFGWTIGRTDTIKAAAGAWIESDDEGPWSYVWCCWSVGLPLDVIRGALRNPGLKKKRKRKTYQGRWFVQRNNPDDFHLYSLHLKASSR